MHSPSAWEVATEGIRVNAVRPGLIHTEIHASAGEPGRVDRAKSGVPMQRRIKFMPIPAVGLTSRSMVRSRSNSDMRHKFEQVEAKEKHHHARKYTENLTAVDADLKRTSERAETRTKYKKAPKTPHVKECLWLPPRTLFGVRC
jgi:NAD(P)-dependent dehydrogenase (short-subunit alcohol dehydrogenase family)